MKDRPSSTQRARVVCVLMASLLTSNVLTGCVVVGASSTGGWFIWPSGLGLLLVALLAVYLLRGRR